MKKTSGYMAFNVSSGFGRFTAYVLMSEGMSAADARKDALTVALGAFHGSAQIISEGRRTEHVPESAWADERARGWGWMQRGYHA